jgi:hypothetical protein
MTNRACNLVTLAMYAVAIGLMASGRPNLADVGIYCWLLALVAAIGSVGVGMAAVVSQGKVAVSALVGAGAILAFGVIVSLLILGSIPQQN